MERVFQRLVARARPLGNPARKHLVALERHGDHLLERLEQAGYLSQVHIDRAAPSLATDFDLVAEAGSDVRESLLLLGTFYSVQFLHLTARSLERLALDVAEHPDRNVAYTRFLRRAEDEYFALTSTYIRRVLRVLQPTLSRKAFLLCVVGTRSHQDDVDLAVLDDGGEGRETLERTLARLSVEMIRHASPLDHYVAEHLGARGVCLSPEEMTHALQRGLLNPVILTELLRSEPLAGSRILFRRLQEEVLSPYFYHRGARDNSVHEMFLRGLMGESRSLLLRTPQPGFLQPKEQGLRLILGLVTALKTITGVRAGRTRELIQLLQTHRPGLRGELHRLENCRVFLETFFHLSQMLIALEDWIEAEGETARPNLNRVARAMGYRDRGALRAVEHLLVHYHEAVDQTREVGQAVMDDITRHLASTSRFARWSRSVGSEDETPDLAREFAVGARAFRGARFWDDVLDALGAPDGKLLQIFIRSFARLPDARRLRLAVQYANWGREAPYALLTLLTLLQKQKRLRREGPDPAHEITCEYLKRLGSRPEEIRAVSRVFRFYPDLMNRFLLTLGPEKLDLFRERLGVPIGDPEVALARDRLESSVRIHRQTSRYIKRVLARITVRFPATVLALSDDRAMKTLALGRLAASERHPRSEGRKGLLGDYHDMEFLRIAVRTLDGMPLPWVRAQYEEMTRTYLRNLLDACIRDAERVAGHGLYRRDRLAVYLAGGNARGRPYDDDYDLLALLDSNEPEEQRVAERAVIQMNREIARRGVVAQYRLGNRFGRFVTRIQELESLGVTDEDDLFVDWCQLLGSRPVAGGRRVETALVERVLRPWILDRPAAFLRRVAEEIRDRRRSYRGTPPGTLHLKAVPGGLRDIDLCAIAYLARSGVRAPDHEDLFHVLVQLDPDRGGRHETLRKIYEFLVAVRSAYRVSAAISDVLERDQMGRAARILGYEEGTERRAGARLFDDVVRRTGEAALLVEDLMEGLLIGLS